MKNIIERIKEIYSEMEEEILDGALYDKDEDSLTADELIEIIEEFDLMELADNSCDVYYSDILEWYKEDDTRVSYIDEAIGNGASDGWGALQGGQYYYYYEKYEEARKKIISFIEEEE